MRACGGAKLTIGEYSWTSTGTALNRDQDHQGRLVIFGLPALIHISA
jgi:hypothetical protein